MSTPSNEAANYILSYKKKLKALKYRFSYSIEVGLEKLKLLKIVIALNRISFHPRLCAQLLSHV